MQLGVAHALLVSDSKPPNCVVGISAGALNAAALIEILQAGAELKDSKERKAVQVARFREFVERYPDVPRELLASMFPDAYEVNQRAPLESVKLPIHFVEERKVRDGAIRARGGLAKALNQVLKVDLPVAFFTILIRRLLAISEVADMPGRWRRLNLKRKHLFGIWFLGWRYIRPLAPVCWGMLFAWLRGDVSWQQRAKRRQKPYSDASSAGAFIFKSRLFRGTSRFLRRLTGGFVFSLLWLFTPIVAGLWMLLRKIRPSGAAPREALFNFVRRLLSFYELDDGIASPDVLKQTLVKLLDPDYYGKTYMGDVLAKALARDDGGLTGSADTAKTIGSYAKGVNGDTPIRLAVVAA